MSLFEKYNIHRIHLITIICLYIRAHCLNYFCCLNCILMKYLSQFSASIFHYILSLLEYTHSWPLFFWIVSIFFVLRFSCSMIDHYFCFAWRRLGEWLQFIRPLANPRKHIHTSFRLHTLLSPFPRIDGRNIIDYLKFSRGRMKWIWGQKKSMAGQARFEVQRCKKKKFFLCVITSCVRLFLRISSDNSRTPYLPTTAPLWGWLRAINIYVDFYYYHITALWFAPMLLSNPYL